MFDDVGGEMIVGAMKIALERLGGIKMDDQGMKFVQTSCGFDIFSKVEYLEMGVWSPGGLMSLAENVKTTGGETFTAFAVAKVNGEIIIRRRDEIRHAPETGLPKAWVEALRAGWKILPCSCECGGSYVWMKPRPSGAHENFGCVCHNNPVL